MMFVPVVSFGMDAMDVMSQEREKLRPCLYEWRMNIGKCFSRSIFGDIHVQCLRQRRIASEMTHSVQDQDSRIEDEDTSSDT